MDLFGRFLQVFDALEREKVDYVLIGGFAVILHGFPRLTQDIDLFIKPDEENVKRVVRCLKSIFNDSSIDDIDLKMLKKYPVVRYGSPEGFFIDLIIAIGEAFQYDDTRYEVREIEGHHIRLATAETLYKMKKDTMRPVDKSDSLFLKELIDKTRG